MLGNLALNLSVDAGLSLVNDVMNAVSGSASGQPLSLSGGAGTGYGSSGFGGQGSFGEMLSNSISGLSNAASSVSDGGQNQGGAFQPAGGAVNVYGGGQASNTAETSTPVSSTGQQPNNGAQTENNINGSLQNNGNGYQAGQPVNNNNTGGSSSADVGKSTPKVSASNGDSPQASSKNGHMGNASGNSAGHDYANKSAKNASKNGGNEALNGNIHDGQNVYFIGNTNINFAGQLADAKKIGVKSGSTNGSGDASEGANSKSNSNINASSSNAGGLSASDGAIIINDGSIGGNNSDITVLADSAKNSNGKGSLNAGNGSKAISADGSSAKSSGADNNNNSNNQNILNKTVEDKTNSNSNSNTADANKINANAVNNGVKADVNMEIINAQNAKTLNEDIKNNVLNYENLKNAAAGGLSLAGSATSYGINAAGSLKNGDPGSLSSNLFGAAGSAVSAAAGSSSPSASGGNSSGFSLTGGGVSGLEDDTAGETTGSLAINSVMFMLRRNVQSATITLNPASLGNVKINISLNPANSLNAFNQAVSSGGAITVNMLAQNEAAKNALHASSDSLQNALKNQGFSTINLNISTSSGYNNGNGDGANESFNNSFAAGGAGYNSGFSNVTAETQTVSAGTNGLRYGNPNALVDYFV